MIVLKKTAIFVCIILTGTTFVHAKMSKPNPVIFIEDQPKNIKVGKASWYSKKSPGINKHTANNEIFDDTAMTAAMWDVPFNQFVKVTNLDNGKSVIVRVNDRGPHKRYVRKGRVIDLSRAAFLNISSLKKGLINIELELL